jgi:hypothetical protein
MLICSCAALLASTSLVVFLLPCAIALSLYLIGLVPAYGVSFEWLEP